MKVIKPMCLGFLARPFEHERKQRLAIKVLMAVPLRGEPGLVSEQDLWRVVPEALGSQPIIDEGMPKSRAEFLVAGSAFPPEPPAVTCPVSVELGGLKKELYAIGDRQWIDDVPSAPATFESMPLTWENAFGGAGHAPNPVGKGLRPIEVDGQKVHPLPNVETPGRLIKSQRDKPAPASYRAVDFLSPVRQQHRGSYEGDYLDAHFPGAPPDQDWRIHNMAAEDQQQGEPFAGDEPYRIVNMHPERPIMEGRLPALRARAFVIAGEVQRIDNKKRPEGELREVPMRLMTVWFLPAHELAVLVHSGTTDITEDDGRDVSLVVIGAERLGQERPKEHYDAVVDRRYDGEWGAIQALMDDDLVPADLAGEVQIAHPDLNPEHIARRAAQRRADRERDKYAAMAEERDSSLEEAGLTEENHPNLFPEIPSLRELPARVREIRADVEKRKKEAEEAFAKSDEGLKEICEEHDLDYEEFQAALGRGRTGPPTITAASRREDFEQIAATAAAKNQVLPWVDEQLEDPEVQARWEREAEQLMDAYRSGAHNQSPAPRLDEARSRELRERLLADLAAGAPMVDRDLTGADLTGIDLSGADLRLALMESVNLTGACLDDAKLDGVVLAHADLTDASALGTSFEGANLGKATLGGLTTDERSTFAEANLQEVRGRGARLRGAKFDGAKMVRCDLGEADLSGATLGAAHVIEVKLDGCRLAGASLRQLVLFDADLSGVDFSGADLTEFSLTGGSVAGANFGHAQMHNARFVLGVQASGCDFRSAVLTSANLREIDLSGSDFSGAMLHDADLSESDLRGCTFYRIKARRSRWVRSDLREATLIGADLMEASMSKADIRNADLRGSNLYGVDMIRIRGDEATQFDQANLNNVVARPRREP